MEPAVCFLPCYTFCSHAHFWRRNPSRCGLTTKPLPSHLRGADSPTPTAQNCTFHRAEQRESGGGMTLQLGGQNQKPDTQTFGCTYKTNARASHFRVVSTVVCVQHNLLDSHGSESNILLRRPPASVRVEHQPEHAF